MSHERIDPAHPETIGPPSSGPISSVSRFRAVTALKRMNRETLVTLALSPLLLVAGCQVSGNVLSSNSDSGTPNENVVVPPVDAADVTSDASGGVQCLAAGGECVSCTAATGGEPCLLTRPCMAVGFQDCGPGAACCLEFAGEDASPYVCSSDAGVIQASSYDQTCTVDTDCAAVYQGGTCNACNLTCLSAAINANALPQYHSDTASLILAAQNLCPSSCGGQGGGPCCRAGICQFGYACSTNGGGGDSGLDAALSCSTAPTVVAQNYDQTCDNDTDCVEVPSGGSACNPCAFHCPGAALTSNGAALFADDYQAALDAYAPLNVGYSCVSGCEDFNGPCCRNHACVLGAACLLDAATADP